MIRVRVEGRDLAAVRGVLDILTAAGYTVRVKGQLDGGLVASSVIHAEVVPVGPPDAAEDAPQRRPADRPYWLGVADFWPCARCGAEATDDDTHACTADSAAG